MADDMVSKAMELEADLLNNFAHALLKAPCFEWNQAVSIRAWVWRLVAIISRLARGLQLG